MFPTKTDFDGGLIDIFVVADKVVYLAEGRRAWEQKVTASFRNENLLITCHLQGREINGTEVFGKVILAILILKFSLSDLAQY